MSTTSTLKQQAQTLVESLPDDATWDDLMYEIYVRQSIEAGLADSEAGRTQTIEAVRTRFKVAQWMYIGQIPQSNIKLRRFVK